MDLIVVIECGADKMMTADYYRDSFNLDIFKNFFDDVKIMGHIKGADIYTKNINSRKFGKEGRNIIRDLAEKEKFAVYSAPIYWGPYMTKGTNIKNFIRYGMSLDYLKLCEKGRCYHTHYLRYIMAKMLRKYFWRGENNYFIGVSKFTMDEVINLGVKGERATYVYSVPDTNLFEPGAKKNKMTEEFNFLFVTQDLLNKAKRPELIVNSMKHMDKNVLEKVRFTFTGHSRDYIRRIAVPHINNIDMVGVLKINELIKLYQSHYFGIHPSYTEGFPRIIFEGMSCGLPYIASPVGGIPEVVEKDYGFLFKDEKELADIIEKVVEDKNVREKMSRNSRKRILELKKDVLGRYEEFFEKTGVL